MITVSLVADARLSRTDAVQKLPGYPTKSTFIYVLSFRTHGARRMVWRESVNGAPSSTLCGANNECAAGRLNHILCDDIQFVNKQDPLNLDLR
jgi:hypothetical protein